MATATYDYIKPIAGGGLGDCKVGIIEFKGDYVTGGFAIDGEPIFVVGMGDFNAKFDGGKLKLMTVASGESTIAPAEVANGTTITGFKAMLIFKGAY